MKPPLGTALVGAGEIGALRAEALRRSPHLRLAAVADTRLEAARRLAARTGVLATDDPVQAIAAPGVELVIVSTPPDRHLEVALAAFSAGKHVLCEKPLAHSVEAAREICDRADAAGVMLGTGFNHRYFPALAFARRLVDRGEIGKVLEVRARTGHPGGEEFGKDWVHDARVTGGGSLVDNGIHQLDLVRFFLGEVHSAKGYVADLLWHFDGVEDTALALFRSADGRLATFEAVWTEWQGYHFAVEVIGSRGFVRASYPPMLAVWGKSSRVGVRSRKRFKFFPLFQLRERLYSWRWTIVQSFVEEFADLALAIRSGSALRSSGRDGLRALEMAAAVYRSDREGIEARV